LKQTQPASLRRMRCCPSPAHSPPTCAGSRPHRWRGPQQSRHRCARGVACVAVHVLCSHALSSAGCMRLLTQWHASSCLLASSLALLPCTLPLPSHHRPVPTTHPHPSALRLDSLQGGSASARTGRVAALTLLRHEREAFEFLGEGGGHPPYVSNMGDLEALDSILDDLVSSRAAAVLLSGRGRLPPCVRSMGRTTGCSRHCHSAHPAGAPRASAAGVRVPHPQVVEHKMGERRCGWGLRALGPACVA